MQTLYKLTNQAGYTRHGHDNACLWGEGVSHSGTGKGALCGPGYIHAYTHPLLAVLLNPIHAGIDNPRLWEAEGEVALSDNGLNVGCRTLTTVRELPIPVVTTEQRISFAILCAREISRSEQWNLWAEQWLSGEDRSAAAAQTASAAEATVWGAARTAKQAAAKQAALEAVEAAWMATLAAEAAWLAARAAAQAAQAAAQAAALDLVALAERAVREEA